MHVSTACTWYLRISLFGVHFKQYGYGTGTDARHMNALLLSTKNLLVRSLPTHESHLNLKQNLIIQRIPDLHTNIS